MSPRKPSRTPRRAPRTVTTIPVTERRERTDLRETLDELLSFVRHVCRNVKTMPSEEVEYAQQRMEWLADEVWRLTLEEPGT